MTIKIILLLAALITFSHSAIGQIDSIQTKLKVSLNLSGWSLSNNQFDKDNSVEGGKIIYQIRVNGNGKIVSARPLQQTVSPSVESFYRRQVMRFELRPKGELANAVDTATGTLTIDIERIALGKQLQSDTVTRNQSAIYLSVSIIRYRGKVIDASPINRDYFGEEDRNKIVHKVSKYSLEPGDALELISNYDWQVKGDKLYKSYSAHNQKDPAFISRSIESFRIK